MIKKENVKTLFDSRFVHVYDLQYEEGRHYYDASRREKDNLVAVKSDEQFKAMLPDAVSCFVILDSGKDEPKLLLTYEYRYPAGQYLLSVPAGLIDPEDQESEDPLIKTAKREIAEETGLVLNDNDYVYTVNPFAFSTPGMTDESNALVCAVVHQEDLSMLSQEGAVGTEKFEGFELVNREEARRLLQDGRDKNGIFYSVFTWAALMYFVSDFWKSE